MRLESSLRGFDLPHSNCTLLLLPQGWKPFIITGPFFLLEEVCHCATKKGAFISTAGGQPGQQLLEECSCLEFTFDGFGPKTPLQVTQRGKVHTLFKHDVMMLGCLKSLWRGVNNSSELFRAPVKDIWTFCHLLESPTSTFCIGKQGF